MKGTQNRWFNYSAFGKSIKNTQILAIKTPLKKEFNSGMRREECSEVEAELYRLGVPLEEELTPEQLVEKVQQQLKRKLAAVIDLTFTTRYYDSKDLENVGVKYAKIKCPGREIPNLMVYTRFKEALKEFLNACDKDSIVAVHCTHGLNRTGYLICRYLIEDGFEVETAIKEFNDARGHTIERENYLQHLRDGCPEVTDPRPRHMHTSQEDTFRGGHINHVFSDSNPRPTLCQPQAMTCIEDRELSLAYPPHSPVLQRGSHRWHSQNIEYSTGDEHGWSPYDSRPYEQWRDHSQWYHPQHQHRHQNWRKHHTRQHHTLDRRRQYYSYPPY